MPTDTQTVEYRSLPITRHNIDEAKREIEVAFASEEPCEREFGYEVLDCTPDGADLRRLNSGGPLLRDHDRKIQIGVVVKAWVDSDRVSRARVRFSKRPEAEAEWQDIRDGIRTKLSVGYVIRKMRQEGKRDGIPVFRCQWTALEISTVSIPADDTVGVGRAHPTFERNFQMDTDSDLELENHNRRTRTQEAERRAEIHEIAAVLGPRHPNKRSDLDRLVEEALQSGISARAFQRKLCEELFPAPRPLRTGERVEMSARDADRYSFIRAIRCAAEQKFDGLEGEMHREAVRGMAEAPSGFIIPWGALTHRSMVTAERFMSAGGHTEGGALVETQLGSFIDILRNRMHVAALGATQIGGLVGNLQYPRQTGSATAQWVAEGQAPDESQMEMGDLNLVPHCVSGFTTLSKQLLMQSSQDIEGLVRRDLAAVIALAVDAAAIAGTGVLGQPCGILNTSGINSTVSFGGTAEWADIVQFETGVEVDNAEGARMGFLTTPTVKGKWRTILKDNVAGAGYLWGDDNRVGGYRAESTNQVPDNKVIFGDWAQLLIAMWATGVDLVVDPYTLAPERKVRVVASMHIDTALRHPQAFNVSSDSGAQ